MKSLLFLTGLASTAYALPSDTHVVHQTRNAVQKAHFVKHRAVDSETVIPFRVALKQFNVEAAEAKLYDISNPKSPNYGKHLTAAEVVKYFASDDKTIDSVKEWLGQGGIDHKDIYVNPTKTSVHVDVDAATLEKLLKTKYHVYRSSSSGKDHVGTDEYSLPSNIANVVDFVHPGVSSGSSGVKFDPKKKDDGVSHFSIEPLRQIDDNSLKRIKDALKAAEAAPAPADNSTTGAPEYLKQICSLYIIPQCISYLYNIPQATQHNISNPLGMYESAGDVYAQEDLDAFFSLLAPYIPKGTGPKLNLINGATAPNSVADAGGESDLDFQMAYPIIYPQSTVLYQVQYLSRDELFSDYLSAIDSDYCGLDPRFNDHKMCGAYEPTNVISVSYGLPEDPAHVTDYHRECNEFLKLGLMGVTTVVASGDAGVSNRNGKCLGAHHDVFVGDNLCSCPYILSVGATKLNAIDQPEVAVDGFSSGGGFSNVHRRPSYQNHVLDNYLLHHNPNYRSFNTSDGVIPDDGGIYNRGGRAYPDVAALGQSGAIVANGRFQAVGGTSMSAPIIAAIFNRINEQRLSIGKGPVGFVNPALYDLASKKEYYQYYFNDVTVGDQRWGGIGADRQYSSCGNTGFSCVEGWDPVTGLGTPRYDRWEDYFVNL